MPQYAGTDFLLKVAAGGLTYEPQTRIDISDQIEVTIPYTSADRHVGFEVQVESEVRFRWDNTNGETIDVTNDGRILYPGTLYKMIVPFELLTKENPTVYLHLQQKVTAATKYAYWSKV